MALKCPGLLAFVIWLRTIEKAARQLDDTFDHPIEYADANLGFGFLIFERACLEFGPSQRCKHRLPGNGQRL